MKRRIAALVVIVFLRSASVSAELVVDDFNDGALNPVWQVLTETQGASWDESGGTLNVGGSSGAVSEELVMRYDIPVMLVGAVRIDYDWEYCTNHKARVGLGLFDSTLTSFQNDFRNGVWIKGIRYRGEPATLHAVDGRVTDGDYHIAYDVPTSGTFWIERDADDFRVRYLDGTTWRDLFVAQHDFGDTPLYPYVFTSNSDDNPSWQIALDNFQGDVLPEPSALVGLLSFGATAALLYLRRRRRRT